MVALDMCNSLTVFLLAMLAVIEGVPKKIDLSQQRGKFQGDISNMPRAPAYVARNAVKFNSQKWPNAIIPYQIAPTFADTERQVILNSIRRLEKSTCIRFRQRTNENDFVFINNTSDGCYSAIGKEGGMQELSLQHREDVTCVDHSTVIHELLHAIGLDHEQSRYDRDRFVTINFSNIEPGYTDQFQIFGPSFSSFYGTPYDYTSVMHYTAYAFSKSPNLVTIQPKDASKLPIIGKVADASYYDLLKVNRMYNCQIATTAEPERNSGCVDQQPFATCNSYLNFCNSWPALKTECAKTCGFCTTSNPVAMTIPTAIETCTDKVDTAICKNYADTNFCNKWPLLKTECKKSCNFCNI